MRAYSRSAGTFASRFACGVLGGAQLLGASRSNGGEELGLVSSGRCSGFDRLILVRVAAHAVAEPCFCVALLRGPIAWRCVLLDRASLDPRNVLDAGPGG